jgi:hypothetical protein
VTVVAAKRTDKRRVLATLGAVSELMKTNTNAKINKIPKNCECEVVITHETSGLIT